MTLGSPAQLTIVEFPHWFKMMERNKSKSKAPKARSLFCVHRSHNTINLLRKWKKKIPSEISQSFKILLLKGINAKKYIEEHFSPHLDVFLTAVTSWWVTLSEHSQSWSLAVRHKPAGSIPSSWEVQHSRNRKGFSGQVWQKCCFLPELPASHWGCRGKFWFTVPELSFVIFPDFCGVLENRDGNWGQTDISPPLHIHPRQERTVRLSGKAENGYWN